ncbi:MAG: fimbrillin family protein [Muribaculaceae bacterium]|nr:fimbrillin family protein [Muribaculaceae bacterium]
MTKKRLFYFALGALLSVTSCSQEDVVRENPESGGKRITFRASLPELSTRASEINSSNLNNFRVSCFIEGENTLTPYFVDKLFSKQGNRYVSSDPDCVWPDDNSRLKFIAFTPSCADMRKLGNFSETDFSLTPVKVGVAEALNYKLENFKVAKDIAKQIDFVTATVAGNVPDNEETGIKLNFRHQLSRIEIKAWGANESYDIEIAGVRIGGVEVEGIFNFIPSADANSEGADGFRVSGSKGCVEYIFSNGDNLITLDRGADSPSSDGKAVSIMGSKIGEGEGYDNSAMLIPANNINWDYENDRGNAGVNGNPPGSYLSVLLRVTDATNNSLGNPVYPYLNNPDNMEVVCLAVDKATKKEVKTRLYKQGGSYFSDPSFNTPYDLSANAAEVKEFGWAALPISGNWQPGTVYTYTLNYSNGVGLREPTDPTHPGESIIGDNVIVNVEMSEWQRKPENSSDVSVPRK